MVDVFDRRIYDDLPQGWLSEEEAVCLAGLARDKMVLEFGAFLGRSTVLFARVARLVVSVDHHEGPPHDSEGSTLRRYLDNLTAQGVWPKVVPILAPFEVVAGFLRQDFDLAYIDGAHDFASALRDGLLAAECVRPGGRLVFHDYNLGGVREAVADLALKWGQEPEILPGFLAGLQR